MRKFFVLGKPSIVNIHTDYRIDVLDKREPELWLCMDTHAQ